MKLIVIAGMLFGSVAMACPDLSGTFICKDEQNSPAEFTVSQTVVNGSTLYTITDAEGPFSFPTDGKTYTSTHKGDGYVAVTQTVGSCSADIFNITYRIDFQYEGSDETTTTNLKTAVSLDASRDLQFVDTQDAGDPLTTVCTRK